jgi:hypothetical protein
MEEIQVCHDSFFDEIRGKYLRDCARAIDNAWENGFDLPKDWIDKLSLNSHYEASFVTGYARALQDKRMAE